MQNNSEKLLQDLSWNNLQQGNRETLSPFQMKIMDSDDLLICSDIIRVIPGKRVVAFGTWAGKAVVAKLFFESKKNALRHAKREMLGIQALLAAGALTPALYYHGMSQDKKIQVLLFEKIEHAKDLETIWQAHANAAEVENLMRNVTIELATQHVFGILQHDLHFKNFLVSAKKIYTIDGGDVEIFHEPLSKKISLDNLALFFSQLGVGCQDLQKYLFSVYAKSRGWLVKNSDMVFLRRSLNGWNKTRDRQYSKKIMRNCTAFSRSTKFTSVAVYDRDYESPAFLHYLNNPEAIFLAPNTELLKAGRSATVIKFTVDNRTLVVKRYNIKGIGHWLRRCMRSTRAATGWSLAHRLRLFGIATPKPIAFIEKRLFGLRGKSYLLMEYIDGVDVGSYFSTPVLDHDLSLSVAEKIVTVLESLRALRLTHGDLKMTNIFIAEQKPILIDLDGMQQHVNPFSFKRKFRQDVSRFMENWQSKPTIRALFASLFAQKNIF
jgi:tRNA A-37 threonylcarbamoyl transferase component Bud32